MIVRHYNEDDNIEGVPAADVAKTKVGPVNVSLVFPGESKSNIWERIGSTWMPHPGRNFDGLDFNSLCQIPICTVFRILNSPTMLE
jgi:hypothetical protein